MKSDETQTPLLHSPIFLGAVIVLTFLILNFTWKTLETYEAQIQSQTERQERTIYEERLFVDTMSHCNPDADSYQKSVCENRKTIYDIHTGTADLAAQRSMARSTKGILYITVIHFVIGSIALAFLGVTVYQTRVMVAEAHDATNAAKKTLKQTQKSNYAELRPYLRLIESTLKITFHVSPDSLLEFNVEVDVENIGKTQAKNIRLINLRDGGVSFGNDGRHSYAVESDQDIDPELYATRYRYALSILNPSEVYPLNFTIKVPHKRARLRGIRSIEDLKKRYGGEVWMCINGSIIFDDMDTVTTQFKRECKFVLNRGFFPHPGVSTTGGTFGLGIRIVEDTSGKIKRRHYDDTYQQPMQ